MDQSSLLPEDSEFLRYLRGLAIFIIVFGHVGGFWFYRPYSGFLLVAVPIFFMISGAVSYPSYKRSKSVSFYLLKRSFSLLIPYYLLCLFSLIVYILEQKQMPAFSLEKLFMWLAIVPSRDIMPFPVGQIWFLYVLLVISILSPFYFYAYERCCYALFSFGLVAILMAAVQHFFDLAGILTLWKFHFFKPLICSLFFISGFYLFFSSKSHKVLFLFGFFSLIASIFLFLKFRFNPDLSYHAHPPDLYYVLISFFFIFLVYVLRPFFLKVISSVKLFVLILDFFYKHTFSIFLLHSFSIYFVERYLGLISEKDIFYGLKRLFFVLLITIILAVPFTRLSSFLRGIFLSRLKQVFEAEVVVRRPV